MLVQTTHGSISLVAGCWVSPMRDGRGNDPFRPRPANRAGAGSAMAARPASQVPGPPAH